MRTDTPPYGRYLIVALIVISAWVLIGDYIGAH